MINELNILENECSCNECSLMCHAPCCGTPEDFEKLIHNGMKDRLMLDDLPGGETMIKPALKGYEGKNSPWQVSSIEGCTFWKYGKCDLHNLNLKPLQGKLVNHRSTEQELYNIGEFINNSWKSKKANQLIERWKKSQKTTV